MLDNLKTLNTNLSAACGEGQLLSGAEFYEDSLQEFKLFPAIGTKLMSIKALPTHSGTIIPVSSDVVLFVSDLVENHDNLVDLYDKTLEKLNIMFGIANARTVDDVDIVDTVFRGTKKGVVMAITINI